MPVNLEVHSINNTYDHPAGWLLVGMQVNGAVIVFHYIPAVPHQAYERRLDVLYNDQGREIFRLEISQPYPVKPTFWQILKAWAGFGE